MLSENERLDEIINELQSKNT